MKGPARVRTINVVPCLPRDGSFSEMRITHRRADVSVAEHGLDLVNRQAVLDDAGRMGMSQRMDRAVVKAGTTDRLQLSAWRFRHCSKRSRGDVHENRRPEPETANLPPNWAGAASIYVGRAISHHAGCSNADPAGGHWLSTGRSISTERQMDRMWRDGAVIGGMRWFYQRPRPRRTDFCASVRSEGPGK